MDGELRGRVGNVRGFLGGAAGRQARPGTRGLGVSLKMEPMALLL